MNKALMVRIAPALLLATTVPVFGASPAHANDDDVIRTGSCSAGADWKLKAGPEDGWLEVEAEVDSNISGQTWRWVLRHEGEVTARARSQTGGRSGSFEVERRTADAAGTDSFRFRAVHRATGQVCIGRVSF